jgi:hypothetical protein
MRRLTACGLVGIACAVAITACGGAASAGTGTTGGANPANYSRLLKFSACMRAHGLPSFPDPDPNGGLKINSNSGISPDQPAFQAASKTCSKLLPSGGRGQPASADVRRRLLAQANCMRAHGVPNFPDPVFPSSGGIRVFLPRGLGIDSPVFKAAAQACGTPVFARKIAAGGGGGGPARPSGG